jgi:hypothetical protein
VAGKLGIRCRVGDIQNSDRGCVDNDPAAGELIIFQDQLTFFDGDGASVCAGYLFAYPLNNALGVYNFKFLIIHFFAFKLEHKVGEEISGSCVTYITFAHFTPCTTG